MARIYGYAPGEFERTLAAWRRHVLPERPGADRRSLCARS
jgi:hypothetical protein